MKNIFKKLLTNPTGYGIIPKTKKQNVPVLTLLQERVGSIKSEPEVSGEVCARGDFLAFFVSDFDAQVCAMEVYLILALKR